MYGVCAALHKKRLLYLLAPWLEIKHQQVVIKIYKRQVEKSLQVFESPQKQIDTSSAIQL